MPMGLRVGLHLGNNYGSGGGGAPAPVVSAALLWTPADATAGTLAAWWDTSDIASRTSSNDPGDPSIKRIDSLADKSGNGHHLTGATTTRPNHTYDWMARQAAGFDATDDVLVSNTLVQAQPMVLYSTIMPFSQGSGQRTVFDAGAVLFRSESGLNAVLVYAGNYNPFAAPPTYNVAQQSRVRFAASTGYITYDGGTETSGAVGASGISGSVRWGNSAANDAQYSGFIGEQILTTGAVTPGSDFDLRMQGYLAWRWGTWDRLPSGHAYRYKAPKVGVTPATPNVPWQATAFIPHGADGDWNATNIFDPGAVDHYSDPTKKFLICTGQQMPVATGKASIGLYTMDVANPTASPTFLQVTLATTGSGWDNADFGLRHGSTIYVAGTYYMYYCTQKSSGANEIGVATSVDMINWTRQGSALITFTGDETCLGEPAIHWDGTTATIIYSYRTGTAAADILPGYRFATSSSLTGPFTKGTLPDGSKDLLRRPKQGLHLEAHQIIYRNGKFHLLVEMGGNHTDGTPYRIYLAQGGANVTDPYSFDKLVLAENPAATGSTGSPPTGGGEKYHVATPGLWTIGGVDYLFRTSAPDLTQPYETNRWNMYVGTATGIFDLAA